MTKILVVEDEASFSDALSYLLGREGFEVTVADTGDGAVAEFDRHGADPLLGLHSNGLPPRNHGRPLPAVRPHDLDLGHHLDLQCNEPQPRPWRDVAPPAY